LLDRFTAGLRLADPASAAALRGRGAIYLANHQVAVETILGALMLGGLTATIPILPAKREHRDTWVGALMSQLVGRPGLCDPDMMRFIDRADPRSLLALQRELEGLLGAGRSVLVHVEGSRTTSARQP